jgi:fucose permease
VENAATAIAMEDPKTRDRNNLVAQSAFSVGAIAMPLLYLLSAKLFGHWRPPYFIAAVLALAFFAFPGKLKDERQAAPAKLSNAFRQYAGFFRRPACLIAPAAMFLYVGAEVGLWAFAPVYFENSGYGMLAAAVSSALIWFMLLLGRFATAGIVGKVGIVRTMLAFSVVAVAAFVMLLLSSGVWAVVWMAVAGFSCGPFFPLIISWMMRLTGEKGGPAIAFTMACGTLGSVLLSGVTGFLAGRLGAQFVMLLPLVCFAGIFILLIRFGKKEQNTPE